MSIQQIVRLIVSRILCVYYSLKIALIIGMGVLNGKEILQVKERPNPPKSLQAHGTHRFVTVNGIRLHYVEKGDHDKPLMLFVHGFPEFWYSWRYQLDEFSSDYWCVAVDKRGYGESDKPDNLSEYAVGRLVSDIRELLFQLKRPTCTLVCHDWGAIIGWRYLQLHMDTIDQYVMMGAPPIEVYGKLAMKEWKQFSAGWYVHFFQAPYLPELSCRIDDMRIFDAMKSKSITDEDLEAYRYTFGKENAFKYPINYYRKNFLYIPEKVARPEVYKRGLFLLGENDLYVSLSSGPMTEKFVPNSKFKVVPGASHFCQQDSYSLVNKLMRDFLAEN